MEDRRDDDRLEEPLPPPPEPPPLPEQPLGPPSMADDPVAPPPPAYPPPGAPPTGYPPPAQAPPPPTAPPTGYPPPPTAPPGQAPPPSPPTYPSPAASPPGQAPPPGYAPPTYAPPTYAPPPHAPPPAYAPPGQPGYPPPYAPYQPPAPAQRGPHGQPMFKGMECASWGRRVGAFMLDVLFAATIPVIVGIVLLGSGSDAAEAIGALLLIGGITVFFPLYAAAFEARSGAHAGQTPGKQVLDIRVVRDGGERLGFGYALLRELVVRWFLIGTIGGFFFFPPFLDYLWPLWDETNRSLHDMVVSTHVVRTDSPDAAGLTA